MCVYLIFLNGTGEHNGLRYTTEPYAQQTNTGVRFEVEGHFSETFQTCVDIHVCVVVWP